MTPCGHEERSRSTCEWDQLEPRTAFLPRHAILEMVVELAYTIPGNIIEFGVADGQSTRAIRRAMSKCEKKYPAHARKKFYACDSFEGLPEKFENAEVGTFKTEPPIIPGVNIVKGLFEHSLTDKLAEEIDTVAFASLDADLYSSTTCALTWLTPLLRSGSVLLFDEFLGENESEKRAFGDWLDQNQFAAIMIAQFMREPSGWGSKIDQRALFQIVAEEKIERQLMAENWAKAALRKRPRLYSVARHIYRLVR